MRLLEVVGVVGKGRSNRRRWVDFGFYSFEFVLGSRRAEVYGFDFRDCRIEFFLYFFLVYLFGISCFRFCRIFKVFSVDYLLFLVLGFN